MNTENSEKSTTFIILTASIFFLGAFFQTGCAREPLPWICPEIQPGDLVLSEFRGDQSDGDQWFEIYNASTNSVDLYGVRIHFTKLDGSSEMEVVVREEGFSIEPSSYFVFGQYTQDEKPEHVNYGFQEDVGSNLYESAGVEIFSCGVEIDQAIYRSLPSSGTLAFDGSKTLSGESNDDEYAWCNDTAGTPGEGNNPCSEK